MFTKEAMNLVVNERLRQINEEKFSREHDQHFIEGELAAAAACYSVPPHLRVDGTFEPLTIFPWDRKWFKPSPENRIRELVKATALNIAEIERLLIKEQFVDLGLPSGKLWAKENIEGYFTYDEAVETFGENLPSREAFKELKKECKWRWDAERRGMVVTGPNGNSIFLPASGYRNGSSVYGVGSNGYFWSSSYCDGSNAYYLNFNSGGFYPGGGNFRYYGCSVRLIF